MTLSISLCAQSKSENRRVVISIFYTHFNYKIPRNYASIENYGYILPTELASLSLNRKNAVDKANKSLGLVRVNYHI